jgi:hypothetical protein
MAGALLMKENKRRRKSDILHISPGAVHLGVTRENAKR